MQHLFQSWQALSAEIMAASHLLLLSDYDGTLTPIVGRPVDAILSPQVRAQLITLAQKPTVSAGVISGRSLSELKSMVAIAGIYYAGNHGLEIEGPGLSFVSAAAEAAQATIKTLAWQLVGVLGSTPGVIIEDKGLSLSVHYRLVKPGEEKMVVETFNRVISPLVNAGRVRITSGKRVLEVRPPIDWHKGKAVEAITRELKALLKLEQVLVIYMGDDTTDEDAFKAVHRPEGWSIFVGEKNAPSSAGYFLNSTTEVGEFLSRLIELK
ncbi:trehalose-phosphatase [Chloroflexota bacterium]